VAISGSTVVVGAPNEDSMGTNAGAAYLFDTSGNQLAKLTASDGGADDRFGSSVAISGSVISAMTRSSVYTFEGFPGREEGTYTRYENTMCRADDVCVGEKRASQCFPNNGYEACAASCDYEAACTAFTFANPGVSGGNCLLAFGDEKDLRQSYSSMSCYVRQTTAL